MKCYKCPYIQEQFDENIQRWDDDEYLIEWSEAELDYVNYCFCEKMGHKLYAGRCSDAEHITKEEWNIYREEHGLPPIEDSEESQDEVDNIPQETKMQKKRRRREEYNQHLKRLSKYHRVCSGAYPVDKNNGYDAENPIRYIRCYNPPRAKWIKKYCNKKVRRKKGIASRGAYKKASEYKWMLW